jgi:hypothetical protein
MITGIKIQDQIQKLSGIFFFFFIPQFEIILSEYVIVTII